MQTVRLDMLVLPPYSPMPYPTLLQRLMAASPTAAGARSVALKQVVSVSKQGVPGNGLCEIGETPTATTPGPPSTPLPPPILLFQP